MPLLAANERQALLRDAAELVSAASTAGDRCGPAHVEARSCAQVSALMRRLAAARKRLLLATPPETVTSIALDCGFDHLGRFALGYRQLFGESPSRTAASRAAESLCA